MFLKEKQSGFTLIEILFVLVLIGILAAVAVPKYFDMQEEAERKAAQAAVAEAQTRIWAGFSDRILQGDACSTAVKTVNHVKLLGDSVETDGGLFGDWLITQTAEAITTEGTAVTVNYKTSGRTFADLGKLYVPQCTNQSENISSNITDEYIKNLPISEWQAIKDSTQSGFGLSSGMLIKEGDKYYFARWGMYVGSDSYNTNGFSAETYSSMPGSHLIPIDLSGEIQTSYEWTESNPCKLGTLYKDPSTGIVYVYVENEVHTSSHGPDSQNSRGWWPLIAGPVRQQ